MAITFWGHAPQVMSLPVNTFVPDIIYMFTVVDQRSFVHILKTSKQTNLWHQLNPAVHVILTSCTCFMAIEFLMIVERIY